MSLTIRIAMLNADIPVPNVLSKRATSYGSIFHELLTSAASRISSNIRIESTEYDVRKNEYPLSPSEMDVILVTGSAASAYDNVEWIHRLDEYILDLYTNHPRVKMFGSCFGHQLICQSLLRDYGLVVEKDPKGWEVGVKEIKVSDKFRNTLAQNSTSSQKLLSSGFPRVVPENMRLQFVHADHVKVPSEDALPSSWVTLGSTAHCAVQGVYQPGRVLTLQGHFEFDRFVNTETLKVFGASWGHDVLKEVLAAIDADDDAETAAEMVVQFLLEGTGEKESVTCAVAGGLLTPPLEE